MLARPILQSLENDRGCWISAHNIQSSWNLFLFRVIETSEKETLDSYLSASGS
jgi:hypothetical protein